MNNNRKKLKTEDLNQPQKILVSPKQEKTLTMMNNTREIFSLSYAMTEEHSTVETVTVFDDPNTIFRSSPLSPSPSPSSFSAAVAAVEEILQYRFINKSLLEEALTHSSYPESASYQRLEFVGDAALGLAVANFVFLTYPGLDPGELSLLRAANISTEKLARVAVRHGLYKFLRHNAPSLDIKVREFAMAVEEEGDEICYAGAVKAPKVLADIVESIAAAVYVDCNFDLKLLWKYFCRLLEPIVTAENLEQQPVTMLYELCQKQGKHVNIKHWRKGLKNIASIYVDGKLVGSACSEQKEIAKIKAAKEALEKLGTLGPLPLEDVSNGSVDDTLEIDGAKQKLNEFCGKKRWAKPMYKVEKEVGAAHERRFVCSVQIETVAGTFLTSGDMKSKVKDAENSAASMMLHGLEDPKFCYMV